TKGWLPYRLRWEAVTTESRRPNRIALRATGDLEGRGIWSILQDGAFTDVTFDWKLTAGKPFLRWLSPVLRPVFEANHRWAMQQGEKSLELELARYRADTVEEMNAVAPPAGPSELWTRALAAGAVLAAGLVAGLVKTGDSHARS
ncbi:MAG: polyketide cyclase, partial [Acidobacteriota bacterium]